jgi:hypothetical protein
MVKMAAFRIVVLWAAALLVAGCAGITPYDPPDYREVPGRGLLSGEDGEFVIYQKEDEPETNNETSKEE